MASMTDIRFSKTDVDQWRTNGFTILSDFFLEEELAVIREDYRNLYGTTGEKSGLTVRAPDMSEIGGALGDFRDLQFKNMDTLPYEGSIQLNMISLHPALIAFAKALLGVEAVHLYQSHTWAKFTGETDYEQDFHCDFSNHTLIVPSDDPALRTVDFIFYLTDVTDGHGALHYVTKPDAEQILGPGRIGAGNPSKQRALKEKELSAAGPAGTLVAHGIDTFHRGTNLTVQGGYRYTMTVGYKAAGNDMVAYHAWQQTGENDWESILVNATPQQLECLGIPLPGDAYWTTRTLKLTQARWPDWDMTSYFAACDSQS
jgi:hypothetical protein